MKLFDFYTYKLDNDYDDFRLNNLIGISFNSLEERPLYFKTKSLIKQSYYRYLNTSVFVLGRVLNFNLRLNKLPYTNFPEYKEYLKKGGYHE